MIKARYEAVYDTGNGWNGYLIESTAIDQHHKKLILVFENKNNKERIAVKGSIDVSHHGYSVLSADDCSILTRGSQYIESHNDGSDRYVFDLPIGRLEFGYGIDVPAIQFGDFCNAYSGRLLVLANITSPMLLENEKINIILSVE